MNGLSTIVCECEKKPAIYAFNMLIFYKLSCFFFFLL